MTDWYKIKRGLIRVNWVEKQFYPATWHPWSNTLAYYPFVDNQLDETGNTSLSAQAWVQQTIWYRFTRDQNNVIFVNWSMNNCRFTSFYAKAYGRVWNFWAYLVWIPICWVVYYYVENNGAWFPYMYSIQYRNWASSRWQSPWRYPISNDTWYHFAYWIDANNNITFYLNWVQQANFSISWSYTDSCTLWTNVDFVISNLILEDKVRTADEVTAYYNQTKSQYGL